MKFTGNIMMQKTARIRADKIAAPLLLLVLLILPVYVLAAEQRPEKTSVDTDQKASDAIPDLAEIVPQQVKLTTRLDSLKKQLQDGGVHTPSLESGYAEIGADLDVIAQQLDLLKDSKEYKYNKLVDLRGIVKQKSESLRKVNAPVTQLIRQLGSLRKEWQAEETRWAKWQASFLQDDDIGQLKPIFAEAGKTIDSALEQILSQLEQSLKAQGKAGKFERKIGELSLELDGQLTKERRNSLYTDTPPLFSSRFLAQLKSFHLWGEVQSFTDEISLPGNAEINQYGWIVLFQLFLSLIFTTTIRKRKTAFKESERWKFLALYPAASGFFLGYMACILMYQYHGTPASWKLAAAIVGGLSFARLMTGIVDTPWKNQFIHGFIWVFITTQLMDVLNFPLPVFRLYTFCAATACLCFCLYLAKESASLQKKGFSPLMFQAGVLFLLFIIIAEILGKKSLPSFLFISLIRSLLIVLGFILVMYIIHGVLDWLFKTKALRRSTVMSEGDTKDITRKLAQFIDALIIALVLVPAILMIWGVYESFGQAMAGVFSFGITVKSFRLTIGHLIVSASILYGSFLVSWVVKKILVDELFFNQRMEKGARLSLARLVNYVIVVIGFLIALSALGIEVSKITIMLSALGVGIGFGLQGIVNNFVSGLVLLFEQPVRVGDLIETNGMWSEIKHIGIRATRVRNFDHADMIIPNADLVSNQVTNWTLGDRQARLIIAVGVAYGSEVNLVMETLIACAQDNTNVDQSPVPQVLFLNFGESSLDFELRVFVKASMRIGIRSELHQEIDKRFRENDINIAFPQRELHVPQLDVRLNNNENQQGDEPNDMELVK